MSKEKKDWSQKEGEVHGDKVIGRLVDFYTHSASGKKPRFMYSCMRCGREYGPAQYPSIIRYPKTRCCTSSKKYGDLRWGFGDVRGDYMRSLHISATKRGLEFEVDAEFLHNLLVKQDRKCVYTGLEISLGEGKASLDRIDPLRGYTKDNVQWVYTPVNYMKWNTSEEEFLELCSLIASRRKE